MAAAMPLLAVALVGGGGFPAVAQTAPAGQARCVEDPAGDTMRESDDSPVDEPRADITRYCVTSGPSASFHVSVAEPTDPASDAGWQRATFVGWFVDTDADGGGDYFIDFSLDAAGSDASADTAEVKRGSDEFVTCTVPAQRTATGFAVSGVEPGCFGGAGTVGAEVAMYYDTGSAVAYDEATDLAPGTIESTRGTDRLSGTGRIETSVAISREQFAPGEAATAYLARGDVFADAAVGGALADGPLLIVPSCGDVPAPVADEIERLEVDTVTALGGNAAICPQMLATAADGRGQARIGGTNRFATSVAIAQAAYSSPERVYVARADEFIDAVAGGTLTDGPVVLVPQCGEVPAVVRDAVDGFDPDEVVALGGTAAVCQETLAQAAGSRAASRLAGESRYGTAIQIARHAFPEPTAGEVYLARADLVVDALAGGVLTDGPVLVVDSCGDFDEPWLQPVGAEIGRNAPDEVVALGGTAAICDDTLAQAGGF
jgi:putative cell wall-binding protein